MLTAAAVGGYITLLRPWHLRWGATADEVRRPLSGDDLVLHPGLVATRATTIHAPAAAVWPWLVQMGYQRAGWYSYDWLDNDGLQVNRIIPEFQHLKVGDVMLTDSTGGFRVEAIEPERALVLMIHGASMGSNADISSAIILDPLDEHHTRLIIRVRAEFRGLRERLWGLIFDFGDFVMMRKMLLGIKQRAEQ